MGSKTHYIWFKHRYIQCFFLYIGLNTIIFDAFTIKLGSNTIIFGAFSIVFGLYTVIFGTFSIIFGSNTLIFDDFSIITFGSNTIIVDAFFIMLGSFVVTSHHQSLRGAVKFRGSLGRPEKQRMLFPVPTVPKWRTF